MKHKTSFSLVFVSRIVIALAIFFVAPPAVGARSSESASGVEAQDAFSAAASVPGAGFVHTATAANTSGNYTLIDHPLTNNDPNAIVLVTHNGTSLGVGNDHPIGVLYSNLAKKWGVRNQDFAAMPIGAAFSVLIPATGMDNFVHAATAANTSGNTTYIDHPLTNNDPNAIVLVTQNWNPDGSSGGTYNDHPIGVYYSHLAKKWSIFNQDFASMPNGADFNVIVIVYKVYLPLVLRGT